MSMSLIALLAVAVSVPAAAPPVTVSVPTHSEAFDEAATCLLDPMALVREDDDAIGEHRDVLVGMSDVGRTLTVCYTMRGDIPRLISTRKATRKEQQNLCARNMT